MTDTTHQGAVGAEKTERFHKRPFGAFAPGDTARRKHLVVLPMDVILAVFRERLEYYTSGSDPDAATQNAGCDLEKAMGIFPNLDGRAPPAPRTDGGMTAGEDRAWPFERTRTYLLAELERLRADLHTIGADMTGEQGKAASWLDVATGRVANVASVLASATPAQPAGAVPESLRALLKEAADVISGAIGPQHPVAQKIDTAIASHQAGQSAGYPEGTSIGERLRQLREGRNQSLHDVASGIGGTKAHLWNLEQGRSCNPSLDLLKSLSAHFGVTVAYLIGETAGQSTGQGADARTVLTEACKPWEHYTGEPPDDGSPLSGVFVAGMVYTERLLAKLLNVTHYEGGDGSEDFDSDATQTLRNILTGAGLWDADENRAVKPAPDSTRTGAAETGCRLIGPKMTREQEERIAHNLCDEFGPEAVVANAAFAKAFYAELYAAARPEAPSDAGWVLTTERFVIAVKEFLADWRKGDFDLTRLAELDAGSIEAALEDWAARLPTPPSDPAPSGQAEG